MLHSALHSGDDALPQTAALESADPHGGGGDELHGGDAPARLGQVRLQQVRFCARTLLPVTEPGGQAGVVPRVPVHRAV